MNSLKQTVVIFVFTQQEAQWAVDFVQKNPAVDAKILAPTIPSQLVLRKHNLPIHTYFDKYLYEPKNYCDRLRKLVGKTHTIWDHFFSKFSNIPSLFGVSLLQILELPLFYEFTVIQAAFDLYSKIESAWNPSSYYLPKKLKVQPTSGNTGYYFATASIIGRLFVEQHKVQTYSTPTYYLHKGKRVALLFRMFTTPELYLVLALRLFKKITLNQKAVLSKTDVILYSFGYNLDYYQQLFSQLATKKPPFSLRVFTGKQTLEAESLLIKHKIPFVPLASLANSEIRTRAAIEAKKAMDRLSSISLDSYEQFFPISLPKSLRKALAFQANLILKNQGTRFVLQIALAQLVIKKCNPKLVITTHDPAPSATPFVHFAHTYHATTLLLLHGIIDKLAADSNYKSKHIAVWGPWMKRLLESHPLTKRSQKFHSIGFPMLDSEFSHNRAQKTMDGRLQLSLLLCQYNPDTFIMSKFLDELFCSIAKELPAIQITARLHREQSSSGFVQLANSYNVIFSIDTSRTVGELMRKSDVVLSMDTTAILWPMIYRKPLFYTTPWWGAGLLPIEQYHAAWIPKSAQEFAQKLKDIRENHSHLSSLLEGQAAFLREYIGVVDGTSSDKLIHLIASLTKI